MKLRNYQQQAVDETEARIAFGSTNLILSATTSWGKSAYISALCQLYKDENIVIMVNIEPLIQQISDTLTSMNLDHSIIKSGRDKDFNENSRIHIVMSQTFYKRYEVLNLKADKLIIDERHLEYDTKRTTLLIEQLKPQTIIGCSATPFTGSGFMLKNAEVIETATGQSLQDDGFLTPLKYYVPRWSEEIDYSRVKKTGNEYVTSEIEEIINTPRHIQNIITSMNHLNAKNKKTLVFCSSIDQCNNIATQLIKDGYQAIAYHSKTSTAQNQRVLESFTNNTPFSGSDQEIENINLFNSEPDESKPIKCLVSVSKLAVGFSVTDIELGVIPRKTLRRSTIQQIIGRMKRLHPGQEFAEILDLSQILSSHGYVDTDHYDPPQQTDDSTIDKMALNTATNHLKLQNLISVLPDSDKPILVTKKGYNNAVKKLNSDTRKLSELSKFELQNKLRLSQDPVMIIAIATTLMLNEHGEKYTANNGKEVKNYRNANAITWISELWTELLPQQSTYHQQKYIKSLRTRVFNMVENKANIWGVRFFIEYLIKEDNPEPELIPQSEDSHIIKVNGIEIEIDDADIPF